MAAPSHDDWLMDLMTRPVGASGFYDLPRHDDGAPHDGPAALGRHMAWLMGDPAGHLAPYDDATLALGLHWLFDGADDRMFRAITHAAVVPADRAAAIAGLPRLFGEALCPRLPPLLGHLSEDGGPLAILAYMLAEIMVLDPLPDPAADAALQEALLGAWAGILALPHAAAQESALHALGHWQGAGRGEAVALIDAFLAEGRAARPELAAYARAARAGCIQ